jgi:phosphoserine/homoserine phosphotransferase
MWPLPGAAAFLDSLREEFQVLILSDTFYEFALPLMRQLGWPTLFCHHLEVDAQQKLTGYRLRQPQQKQRAVQALQGLNFKVIAAGDSYNDTGMLMQAERGIFFCPPAAIAAQFPQFPVTQDYPALRQAFAQAQAELTPIVA